MKKQIEEMYKDLCESKQERKEFCDNKECRDCEHFTLPRRINCETFHQAKLLIAKGYRKQSEGAWKKVSEKYPRYVCTACNHLYNNKEYKYCPNCGARMKGADNEKAD